MAMHPCPAPLTFFHPGRALVFAASMAAASLTISAASASLLEEPPRLWTFKLDDPASPKLSLLRAFHNAEIERPGPLRRYLGGTFGQWRNEPWWTLAWKPSGTEQASAGELDELRRMPQPEGLSMSLPNPLATAAEPLFGFEVREPPQLGLEPGLRRASFLQATLPIASSWLTSTGPSFASDGFDSLWAKPAKPIRDWRCRRRPVVFSRYGGESGTFALVRCDGSVAPEALDRLSLMARPPEVASPGELLPEEPDPQAWQQGEWLPGVRLVHPRLLWLLQRIADAFPHRPIYIFSGYRPNASVSIPRVGSHPSLHAEARAMDISVYKVPNTALFEFCRTLDDVGCGFYPNSKFVHVDVRRPGTGRPFWIDISSPGEPSRYVDSWPGVVDAGAAVWDSRLRAKPAE
jgi:hypothetical protein